MSRIRANQITNKTADGATTATNGFNVTGVCTATSFSGDGSSLTGISQAGGATGLDFNDDVKVRFGNTNDLVIFYENSGADRGKIGTVNNRPLDLLTNNTQRIIIENSGHVRPATNNNYDLGTGGDRWRNVYGVDGNFSGALTVSGNASIGGVLTYEDVTNVDSVGIVTARSGIDCNGDIDIDGHTNLDNVSIAGVTTAAGVIEGVAGENKIPSLYANLGALPSASTYHGMFAHVHSEGKGYFAHGGNWIELVNKDTNGVLGFTGALKEQVKITAGKLSANTDINLSDGMVHYFTTNETATATPNIRFSGSVSLDSAMAVGETISVTLISATNSASYYYAQLNIDGAATTENWVGGSAPSDGGASGVDIYTYNIIKTASATFTVIANQTKTS